VKILFVYQTKISFVERDWQIFEEVHEVRGCQFRGLKDLPDLLRGVMWSEATFVWFGKLHAFFAVVLSKLLGKKAVVVAGGDDVAKHVVADKPYGVCAHPLKKWFAYFIFKNAEYVIAISEFNLEEALQNAKADPGKTGLIYHGFDAEVFQRLPAIEKEKMVVTVGDISKENCRRKGLELFVETAHLLREVRFMLVGPDRDGSIELLRRIAPPNLTFAGGRYGRDLVEILSRASVYVQASEWESFGCALAEAMLCECVPVVFRGTALPEVVGDCGYYIERLNSRELARAIEEAMRDSGTGRKARGRIVELFPLEKRRKALLAVLASLR